MRDEYKRLDIFEKSQKKGINILCLQETHTVTGDQKLLKTEWNATHIISGTETNSGGTLIIIENNFEFKLHSQYKSEDGRYIIIDIEIPEVARFILVNLYAPNKDSPNFFEKLFENIETMNNKNNIMIGDWNLVENFDKDTLNYKKLNNLKDSIVVNSFKKKWI